MMGIYLLVIATHDVMLHGRYNTFALTWMTSWTCKLTGIIAVTSFKVSLLILTTLSVTCFISVTLPHLPHHITIRRGIVILTVVWLTGLALAVVPVTSPWLFGDFYGGNGVCLPLHIHDPYAGGWQYSAFIFLGVNLAAMLVIVLCYMTICCSVLSTSARANNPGVDCQDRALAMRFFLIILSNLACWIPISVVKIIAFTDYKLSGIVFILLM